MSATIRPITSDITTATPPDHAVSVSAPGRRRYSGRVAVMRGATVELAVHLRHDAEPPLVVPLSSPKTAAAPKPPEKKPGRKDPDYLVDPFAGVADRARDHEEPGLVPLGEGARSGQQVGHDRGEHRAHERQRHHGADEPVGVEVVAGRDVGDEPAHDDAEADGDAGRQPRPAHPEEPGGGVADDQEDRQQQGEAEQIGDGGAHGGS